MLRYPYPTCIFCGEKANSREHAIPKWLSKRFGLEGIMLHSAESSGVQAPRKQPISFASHRARIMCSDCNTHFKHLEDSAIPIIEPMARGQQIVLGDTERKIAAVWGAKTGIALISAERWLRELVPIEHRLTIRQLGEVPESIWVSYTPWQGAMHAYVGDHTFLDQTVDPPRPYRAYGAVLIFAHLALKVLGLVHFPLANQIIEGDMPSIKQVWPDKGYPIRWPPPVPAKEGNFQTLIDFVPLQLRA